MVYTRLYPVKMKKYDLSTNKNVSISNSNCDDCSNIVNSDNSVVTIVCETQTQVVEATQDTKGYLGTSEALSEEVADLDGKTANELEKLLRLKSLLENKARGRNQALLRLRLQVVRRNSEMILVR